MQRHIIEGNTFTSIGLTVPRGPHDSTEELQCSSLFSRKYVPGITFQETRPEWPNIPAHELCGK